MAAPCDEYPLLIMMEYYHRPSGDVNNRKKRLSLSPPEIAPPRARKGVVWLSSVCDAYQPLEAKYKLTRRCLEVLAATENDRVSRLVEPGSVILIYDDLDIPIGDIRVRKQGTAGTHKGMQSIVQETGSTRFPRIRIGIGPLPPGRDAADFVLSPFTRSEKALLAEALDKAREALLLVLDGRIDQAMTAFN